MNKQDIVKLSVSVETIQNKIYLIRGQKVMLDHDLAQLYEVSTKRFNEQVKRNLRRFPKEFMFQLTDEEYKNLRSQSATSSWGGRRYLPYVFTDYGVAMLSSVLNSDRAVEVNIQIMRVFTKLRQMIESHKELREKIEAMEKTYDAQFKVVFEAIRRLMVKPTEPNDEYKRTKVGFVVDR